MCVIIRLKGIDLFSLYGVIFESAYVSNEMKNFYRCTAYVL